MGAGIEIPLFPLNTVLFPGGPLELRIFEARYIDMIRRCMRESSGFGVVLIREGSEAGGPTTTFDVGTCARITDFSQQPDGLLGISAVGVRRFRILEQRRARDGLYLGDIEWLPAEQEASVPEEFADLGPAVEAAMSQAGVTYLHVERRPGDAAWLSARLAEILPLPAAHKQHCLELDDPLDRLRYLRPLFEINYR